ncbi:MAG: hypothetical protein ABGZ24_29095, partial [Fuerstiella sp.]
MKSRQPDNRIAHRLETHHQRRPRFDTLAQLSTEMWRTPDQCDGSATVVRYGTDNGPGCSVSET